MLLLCGQKNNNVGNTKLKDDVGETTQPGVQQKHDATFTLVHEVVPKMALQTIITVLSTTDEMYLTRNKVRGATLSCHTIL